ncbi:hypothetical protein TorRG33x02_192570 [Trema orientale]|uniref:Uncharacterized protein n=1 Tax=Trema orientale TaxID=63057 RepID=A0A2P5EHI5_TREOI|nr:hypothetical protein TorRG33x02_192570 [Trema orientale]
MQLLELEEKVWTLKYRMKKRYREEEEHFKWDLTDVGSKSMEAEKEGFFFNDRFFTDLMNMKAAEIHEKATEKKSLSNSRSVVDYLLLYTGLESKCFTARTQLLEQTIENIGLEEDRTILRGRFISLIDFLHKEMGNVTEQNLDPSIANEEALLEIKDFVAKSFKEKLSQLSLEMIGEMETESSEGENLKTNELKKKCYLKIEQIWKSLDFQAS